MNIKNINVPRVIKFNEAYKIPEMKWNIGRNLIEWGDYMDPIKGVLVRNAYPEYLLDLYNVSGASIHKAIINRKTKLIGGQGFDEIKDQALREFVEANKLDEEVRRAILDYQIFNGYAFEVIWNNEGSEPVRIKHIPFHKLRIGIVDDEYPYQHFWYSHNWKEWRKAQNEPFLIKRYSQTEKEGKRIYYYSEYNPQTDGLYPIPEYSTVMNWVELGYEISRFHLNQAKQGYAPSAILNFSTGIPSVEEQDDFERDFKRTYSGTENAGKIIITWSDGEDGKPTMIPFELNSSDTRFTLLEAQSKEEIVQAAEMPVQLLISQAGKLGSTDERVELMNEFQMGYVSPRQTQIEDCLWNITKYISTEQLILKKYTE